LADLGVSSHHFDAKHRGFSFRGDAPLDMRMNTRARRTAADIVNSYSKEDLAKIFAEYGELDTTWKIANCIERARAVAPITTTAELVEAVKPCTPPKDEAKFLTKLFQALRIELNGEMEALKMALEQSLKLLKPGGRLVVMSYHSLEDRIVKNFMRSGNAEGRIEKDFFGRSTTPLRVITRKAIIPGDEEIELNPRSRSAKLRVAEKIESNN
jgi:16S rRNA (cytosine1402-N4)-methyltransferase